MFYDQAEIFQIPCTLLRSTRLVNSHQMNIMKQVRSCFSHKRSLGLHDCGRLSSSPSVLSSCTLSGGQQYKHLSSWCPWPVTATRTDGDHWSNLTQIKHCPKSILCSNLQKSLPLQHIMLACTTLQLTYTVLLYSQMKTCNLTG